MEITKDDHKLSIASENHFISECILWRFNYFWCGHSKECHYNLAFVGAVEAIGKFCTPDFMGKNSNYHKGIAYIAKKSGVSKTQVKAIRRKLKKCGGYEFKTSYDIAKIIDVMINALKEHENEDIVRRLMTGERLYRNMIMFNQYSAIKTASTDSRDERLRAISEALDKMQQTID